MSIDTAALRERLATAAGDTLQIGDVLGAGGFAAVFSARDPFLERDVAIKVLDPALGISEELEESFLREARIVAGVEHPHIVPLYAAESLAATRQRSRDRAHWLVRSCCVARCVSSHEQTLTADFNKRRA